MNRYLEKEHIPFLDEQKNGLLGCLLVIIHTKGSRFRQRHVFPYGH